MNEYVMMGVVALQWAVIMWMLVTHRVEVKRLTTDLKDMMEGRVYGALSQRPPVEPPDTITVPHPEIAGREVTMYHLGAGNYGPVDGDIRMSGVEEVEGRM